MNGPPVSGIERAVFGGLDRDGIDRWLDAVLRRHLGWGAADVVLRSGRVSAVYGFRLEDGQHVAVKVHRAGADVAHLAAAVGAQQHLAGAGYPCPRPLLGPVTVGGCTLVAETLLLGGQWRDPRQPAVRRVLAAGLADQVAILRGVPTAALRSGAPAWMQYEHGPWPTPHDPIMEFSSTPEGYAWLDALAARAAQVLRRCQAPDVVGHGDWYPGNVRFCGTAVHPVLCAAYDWDSLAARPEPVIAGVSAGSHTLGGAEDGGAPTPAQVAAFLDDYGDARLHALSADERATAAAAACWVLAYDARCELAVLPPEEVSAPGRPLQLLAEHGDAYLDLT